MKFGGASLSTGNEILNTCKIVKLYLKKDRVILVVSAMKDITDQLFEIVEISKKRNLQKSLQEGALIHANRDLNLAGEWFSLDNEI